MNESFVTICNSTDVKNPLNRERIDCNMYYSMLKEKLLRETALTLETCCG